MSKIIDWLKGFFSENAPDSSSTRLIMILGTLIPLFVWVALSGFKLSMQPFPESVLVFIGLCLGTKGIHKALETRQAVAQIEKNKPVAAKKEDSAGSSSKTVQVTETETSGT